jgi:hypothetical protein
MEIKWPSALVALGVFALIGTIVVTAILKYATVDEAMTVFSGLWGALGAGVGLLFAYFFTRGTVQQAQTTAIAAKESSDDAHKMAQSAMALTSSMKDELVASRQQMAEMYRGMKNTNQTLLGAVAEMEPNQAKSLLDK